MTIREYIDLLFAVMMTFLSIGMLGFMGIGFCEMLRKTLKRKKDD